MAGRSTVLPETPPVYAHLGGRRVGVGAGQGLVGEPGVGDESSGPEGFITSRTPEGVDTRMASATSRSSVLAMEHLAGWSGDGSNIPKEKMIA